MANKIYFNDDNIELLSMCEKKPCIDLTSKPSVTLNTEDIESLDDDGNVMDFEEHRELSESDLKQIESGLQSKNNLDMTANDIMKIGSEMEDIKPLFKPFFYENEISVLFAESNLGKSILAVQIGEYIAKHGKKVCYFDYELTTKQFQERYTKDKDKTTMYKFSDNFYRPILDYELEKGHEVLLERFYETIENKANDGFKVFILDNITYLSDRTNDKSFIMNFLKNLKEFKKKHNVSFLIIAHTPKRKPNKPLEQGDLAGSKAFMNFIDSSFAIGRSIIDSNLLYLKQIKVRVGRFTYNDENVLKCQIVKEHNFVHFKDLGTEVERHLLDKKYILHGDNEKLMNEAWKMHCNGDSNRAIARQLSVTDKTIAKWIDRMEQQNSYINEESFAIA